MLRIALTALWSRKRRLVGTTLAVVLGVTFLSATLILSDTTRAGFKSAFVDANAGIDARVRSSLRLSGGEQALPTPLDASIVGLVSSVPGVARVAGSVEGTTQILGADGTPLGGNGPPAVGAAWIDEPGLTPYALAEGRAPRGPGEVVIDRGSATKGKLAVGATTTVLTPAPVPVTVVGTATFAGEDSLGGVTFAAFTPDEAQRVLLGGRRQVTSVEVQAADGVQEDELVMRLAAVLPPGVEAISGDDLTAEQRAEIEGDFLGFMETALLAFAAVALLVAGFSIYNTFAVLAAQRSRESALLRALGASRVQVLGAGLAEAVMVGLAGSALGMAAGAGVALGARALLEANGFGLPGASLRVGGSTMVIATVVGTLVAVVAALVPAWRASRIAPLAALRAVAVEAGSPSRWRIVVGAAVGGAGTFLVLGRSLSGAGLGALLVVVAVVVCGPALARPVVSVLAAPIGLRGVAGDLARRNALRNPRRTSATSAALLVGVAVVTLFVVFGASVSASIEEAVDRSFGGDLVVESSGFSGAGLSPTLLDEVRALPEVDDAAGLGFGAVLLDGADKEAGFADVRALEAVADFEVVEGSWRRSARAASPPPATRSRSTAGRSASGCRWDSPTG